MSLSAAEDAAAVGMTKASVIKAIKSGRISAEKNQRGEWSVWPMELFRYYEPAATIHTTGAKSNCCEIC